MICGLSLSLSFSKGVFFTSLCVLFVCFVCFYLNDNFCNFFMYTVASLQQFSSFCVYLLKTSSCLSISSFSVHVYIPLHKLNDTFSMLVDIN